MELFGILLPLAIDLINRKIENSDVRTWVSITLCVAVGSFFNYLDTMFIFFTPRAAFDSITASILITFGLAQLSYQTLYKYTGLKTALRNNQPADDKLNDA